MISIQYLCPQCSGSNKLDGIEQIKNEQNEYPLTCCHCGARVSKGALIKFARSKAEEMINEALMQLKNPIHQGNK